MSRKTLLERHNLKLSNIAEEIHANEATDQNGSLKTLLKGKRNVGFIDVNENIRKILEKRNFGIILVRKILDKTWKCIVYNPDGKNDAIRLFNIVKSKQGYLTDNNAEEAREIGKLLGYSNISINEYVQKKYGKKIPVRVDTEDDYDYLSEQKTNIELNKKLVRKVKDINGNDVKICAVNGSFIKGTNPGLDFIEFVEGGHYYVDSYPGYKKNIPEDEIWIDDVFLKSPDDFRGILSHEMLERNLMKYKKMSYNKAHEYANKAEKKIRQKKLNEDFQFKETIRLMNKIVTSYLFFHWFFLF